MLPQTYNFKGKGQLVLKLLGESWQECAPKFKRPMGRLQIVGLMMIGLRGSCTFPGTGGREAHAMPRSQQILGLGKMKFLSF